MKPRRLEIADLEAVPLVNPSDLAAVQTYIAGWLVGSLRTGGLPFDIEIEAHAARDRLLPSFTVHVGRHRLVVHVDQAIG